MILESEAVTLQSKLDAKQIELDNKSNELETLRKTLNEKPLFSKQMQVQSINCEKCMISASEINALQKKLNNSENIISKAMIERFVDIKYHQIWPNEDVHSSNHRYTCIKFSRNCSCMY